MLFCSYVLTYLFHITSWILAAKVQEVAGCLQYQWHFKTWLTLPSQGQMLTRTLLQRPVEAQAYQVLVWIVFTYIMIFEYIYIFFVSVIDVSIQTSAVVIHCAPVIFFFSQEIYPNDAIHTFLLPGFKNLDQSDFAITYLISVLLCRIINFVTTSRPASKQSRNCTAQTTWY